MIMLFTMWLFIIAIEDMQSRPCEPNNEWSRCSLASSNFILKKMLKPQKDLKLLSTSTQRMHQVKGYLFTLNLEVMVSLMKTGLISTREFKQQCQSNETLFFKNECFHHLLKWGFSWFHEWIVFTNEIIQSKL